MCESAASRVKAQRGRKAHRDGEALYDRAKADSDACISFICAGMVRRFDGISQADIQRRVIAAQHSANEFLEWANPSPRNQGNQGNAGAVQAYAGIEILGDFISSLPDWYSQIQQEQDRQILMSRDDLLRNKLSPWDEL
jgi:hypothetical protein